MNIGIDIDDTISNTTEQVDKSIAQYFKKILNRELEFYEIENPGPYWIEEVYGLSKEEMKEYDNNYYEINVMSVEPKKNSINIINKLGENNKIIIITARLDYEDKRIEKATLEWLKKYNVHYDELYMGHEDKRNIVKEKNIDIFIDDNYKTCKAVAETGVKTFMMTSRLNKKIEDDNIERVNNWDEIEEKINEKTF